MSKTFSGVGEQCVACGRDAAYLVRQGAEGPGEYFTCGRHLSSVVDVATEHGRAVLVTTPEGES